MNRYKSFDNKTPILYLIATPIGNLKEMTPRAIEVISSSDILAAEDTRNANHLLSFFNIKKETFSLREHNEIEASNRLINLIKSGKQVSYMSDAGYPCISDPGAILVKLALKEGIKVSTICGSSAFINALVSSGHQSNHFYFHGFLSSKPNEARSELISLKNKEETLIFYESPHRIKKTLEQILDVFGPRECTIGRELTKLNEEFIHGTLDELINIDTSTLIGEMVVIVEGNKDTNSLLDADIEEKINYFLSKGISNKTIVDILYDQFHYPRNKVKEIILKKQKE